MEIVAVRPQAQQEARIDTRALAEAMGNEHPSVIRLIDRYIEGFERFGPIGFEIGVGTRGGIPVRFTSLNEGQCYFLLTLVRNTDQTVAMKQALIEKVMQAFNLIRAREHAEQARALEARGRHELVQDARQAARDKMATQVVTAAGVGQAYGGGKAKALAQLSLKGIQPLGYFTSMGKEVEVYSMLDVFQQFNAGLGPRDGRVLMACEWDWTPYPQRQTYKLGSR